MDNNNVVEMMNLAKYNQNVPNLSIYKNDIVYYNREEGVQDNSYLEYMLDIYTNNSSTHSNLINLKKELTQGQGFKTEDPATVEFLKNINYHQTADDLLEMNAFDMALYETAPLLVHYSRDGKKIVNVYHVDAHTLRAKKANNYGIVEGYYFSNQWHKGDNGLSILKNYDNKGGQQDIQYFPIFNPKLAKRLYTKDNIPEGREDLIGSTMQPIQLLYKKRYTSGQQYYAVPSYSGGIPYIELDKELGVYHLNSVTNNFTPSLQVSIVGGSPDDSDKRKMLASFRKTFEGTENASKVFMEWVDDKDGATIIKPFEAADNNDLYNTLNTISTEKIANAHRAHPEIAGISKEGASLGGDSNKLMVSRELFFNQVILGYQSLIEGAWNDILAVNGLGPVKIKNERPLLLMDNDLISSNLTQDEIRERIFGLNPIKLNKDDE